MSKELAKKLRIQSGQKIIVFNSPKDFKFDSDLNIKKLKKTQRNVDVIYLFVRDSSELEKNFSQVITYLNDKNFLWLFYPKSSSNIRSDLKRDSIMRFVKNYSLKISTLISYNNDWAAFLIKKIKPEDLQKKSNDLKQYYPFIDFEKRIVVPPEDFLRELKKKKKSF